MYEFEDKLFNAVRERINRRREKGATTSEMVSHMLEEAYRDGRINERQFRDNLKITFLTAHENAQQLINSTFWELGKNQVREPSTNPSAQAKERIGSAIPPPSRNPQYKHLHPNGGNSKLPPLPYVRHLRTPPPLPARLPTNQPRHPRARASRRRDPNPQANIHRLERLWRAQQPANLGFRCGGVRPGTVGEHCCGDERQVPAGDGQGDVYPV